MGILLFLPIGAMLAIALACGQAARVAAAPRPIEVLAADVQQKGLLGYLVKQ
jgi:hypothetical protein